MTDKLVALFAVAIPILTAVLYLSGYGYLFGYYQFFDIGVWELELSLQDIISHSASAILSTLQNYYLILVVATFFVSISTYLRRTTFNSKDFAFALLCVVTVTCMVLALLSSVASGRSHASSELRLLNRLHLPVAYNDEIDTFFEGRDRPQLLHLASTKTTFFSVGVYNTGRDRWVIRIPRDGRGLSLVYQDP